jgi:hypothetical protein
MTRKLLPLPVAVLLAILALAASSASAAGHLINDKENQSDCS